MQNPGRSELSKVRLAAQPLREFSHKNCVKSAIEISVRERTIEGKRVSGLLNNEGAVVNEMLERKWIPN